MPNVIRRKFDLMVRRVLSRIDRTVAGAVRRELESSRAAHADSGPPASKAQDSEPPPPPAEPPNVTGTAAVDIQTEISAVWEGHDNEDYRQDQSHWRGVGRWSGERWESIGEESWRRVNDLYRTTGRSYPTDPPPVFLEWGPGGGSNLHRFAENARILYGVDISAKNLEESGRVLEEKGEVDFRPLLLDDEPATIAERVTEPLDLVVSTSVFQHFPSAQYGAEVLRVMRSLMAPSGVGYVQIRFDNGNPMFIPKQAADYQKHHLTATSYDLSEFWDLLAEVGFVPLKIANVNTKANYAGFYFTVPRS